MLVITPACPNLYLLERTMYDFLLQSCILVLLPLVPAFILFKFLPSSGNAGGDAFGLTWKFGGAFAGYLIVFLLLQHAVGPLQGSEVWTVRGKVDTGNATGIENLAVIKLHPPESFAPDGSYQFQVIVKKVGQQREFPKVMVDLRRLCGDIRTISLDNTGGTFAAISTRTGITVQKNDWGRTVEVEPIALHATKGCGGT